VRVARGNRSENAGAVFITILIRRTACDIILLRQAREEFDSVVRRELGMGITWARRPSRSRPMPGLATAPRRR